MSEVLPLERVERACRDFRPVVKDIQTAKEFVSQVDLRKCNPTRYLAWMLLLDGLPCDSELWPKTFYYLVRSYRAKLDFYPMENSIPTCLDLQISRSINSDVQRGNGTFRAFARALGIPDELCEDAVTRITRLTIIMFKEAPQHHYLQGYDRFALISYALALSFVFRIGLSYIEAEALALSLFRRLIPLCDADSYLDSGSLAMKHFSEIDAFLRVHNPELMEVASRRGSASAAFAANWSGVLFADSHAPLEVLLIWDQFVYHHEESLLYFKAMTSAHLMQVPKAQDEFIQLQQIQTFDSWDIARLLNDAEALFNNASYGEPILPKYSLLGLTSWL